MSVDVLVVRHAIALDKDEANELGVADADRPLTKDGRRRMRSVARGLSRSAPKVSALFTSPLRRAVETAAVLRARFKCLEAAESDALLPDAQPEALAQCLAEYLAGSPAVASVAVVGHEPHLSNWVSWCLTERQTRVEPGPVNQLRSLLELRKGGACLLRFEDVPGPSLGKLIWLMTPAVLRQL
jgi:phosphohistidine phosphatase